MYLFDSVTCHESALSDSSAGVLTGSERACTAARPHAPFVLTLFLLFLFIQVIKDPPPPPPPSRPPPPVSTLLLC